jgi:hypothetical protein
VKQQIDRDLRQALTSDFAIAAELQNEIKIRLSPFWFDHGIVDVGPVGAGSQVLFPLTSLTKIIANSEHPDKFAEITAPTSSLPKLWYAAACGLVNEKAAEEFEAVGMAKDQSYR